MCSFQCVSVHWHTTNSWGLPCRTFLTVRQLLDLGPWNYQLESCDRLISIRRVTADWFTEQDQYISLVSSLTERALSPALLGSAQTGTNEWIVRNMKWRWQNGSQIWLIMWLVSGHNNSKYAFTFSANYLT